MLEDYILVVIKFLLYRFFWNVNFVDIKNWLLGMIVNMYFVSLNLVFKFNEFKFYFTCCIVCG